VDMVAVLGLPHEVLGEGIFAFVRLQPGATLTPGQVLAHCKKIASYKRPQHVEVWPAERPFPLTRTMKVDKLILQDAALAVVERLKSEAKWGQAGNLEI